MLSIWHGNMNSLKVDIWTRDGKEFRFRVLKSTIFWNLFFISRNSNFCFPNLIQALVYFTPEIWLFFVKFMDEFQIFRQFLVKYMPNFILNLQNYLIFRQLLLDLRKHFTLYGYISSRQRCFRQQNKKHETYCIR